MFVVLLTCIVACARTVQWKRDRIPPLFWKGVSPPLLIAWQEIPAWIMKSLDPPPCINHGRALALERTLVRDPCPAAAKEAAVIARSPRMQLLVAEQWFVREGLCEYLTLGLWTGDCVLCFCVPPPPPAPPRLQPKIWDILGMRSMASASSRASGGSGSPAKKGGKKVVSTGC